MSRRVGFVVEWYPPHVGGVEVMFAELARALAARGDDVTVVTTWVPGTPLRETVDGVHVIRVRTPPVLQRYLFTLWAIPTVLRALRGVDLIHTTTYNAAVPGWVASVVLRKPAVLTVHEVWAEQWNSLLGLNRWVGYGFRLFEWLVLHLPFAHYHCVSEFTRVRLVDRMRVPADRTSVVHNSVDYDHWDPGRYRARPLRAELGFEEDAFVYLFFGRPGISKGVEYLVDAASKVRAAVPGSRLVMLLARDPVGGYEAVLARVREQGLTDHVAVLDPVPRDELPTYLLAADAVVVPSVSEGFGYSALEATVVGATVVATTGHSVEEIIPDAAVFVPPRDPDALAQAVIGIASGAPAPGPPGVRYDVGRQVAGIVQVYDDVLRVPRQGP